MVKIITVKVSKGGVGKTTIASNLSYLLSQKGHKILLVDLDAQSNLSKNFLREIDDNRPTSSNLLGDEIFDFKSGIHNINENLDLIISDIGLSEVARYLEKQPNYFNKLNELLSNANMKEYDFIFFDLSPGVSDTLTDIALCASDLLICPTHFDVDSLAGLILTIEDISRLNEANLLCKNLNYLVVPNRHDKRFKSDNQAIIDMLYENLDEEFIATPIRENSHIKKARMLGQSVIEYESNEARKHEHKKAIEDFEELAKKVIEILEK